VTAAAQQPDKRLKLLDATIKKNQGRRDALIEVLHRAQELYGYLDTPVLWHVARMLKQPPSRVFGVATFYHLFRLKPQGKHTCVVCLGTACFVKGAEKLIAAVERTAHVKSGQTTIDGEMSFVTARCIGACGIAPAVVFDAETCGQMTPDRLNERLKGWVGDGTR
jgi:bidirectional [NiFe] hydrogenase diaphorase subunit